MFDGGYVAKGDELVKLPEVGGYMLNPGKGPDPVHKGRGLQDLVVGRQGKGWLLDVAWQHKPRLLVKLRDCMTGL
ncbi:hypothetical protein R6Q57_000710 [Mikania cordata]